VSTLVVLGFADTTTADVAAKEVEQLNREGLLNLIDWARVIRRLDGSIDVRQGVSTTGVGAMGGTLWGALFGLIFLMPIAGAVVGAVTGAIGGKLADVGIDDDFIKEVREKVTEGTSALFALTSGATAPDKIIDELKAYDFEIISTNLPEEQEEQLREAFAQE
jgi:uncharacterized membrane protein